MDFKNLHCFAELIRLQSFSATASALNVTQPTVSKIIQALGLFLMLALLGCRIIRPGMVEHGAKWALGELVFFFIPIMVSVLQYQDLLMSEGWQLILTIAVGTALVMVSTALTLDFCYRWKRRLYKKLHS